MKTSKVLKSVQVWVAMQALAARAGVTLAELCEMSAEDVQRRLRERAT